MAKELITLKWSEVENSGINRNPEDRAQKLRSYGPWDDDLANPPHVWYYKKKYLILDGAGSHWMALDQGMGSEPAQFWLHDCVTPDDALKLSIRLNRDRVVYGKMNEFMSRLRNKGKSEQQIEETAVRYGFDVGESGSRPANQLRCPEFLYEAYLIKGALDKTLYWASSGFGSRSNNATSTNTLMALLRVYSLNTEIDDDRLIGILRELPAANPAALKADALSSKYGKGFTLRDALANYIIQNYNTGIRQSGYTPLEYVPKPKKGRKPKTQ